MNEPVDLIIPYVTNNDSLWRSQYLRYMPYQYDKEKSGVSRFRDFDTFELLLRLIDKYTPWFRNIYVVVQMPSQVPDCVSKYENVKIIYHNEIIPEEYLPTYNSGTIELFVWKIPGLSEHYIYANDDIYPIAELTKDDFFDEEGNPKMKIYCKEFKMNEYRMMLKKVEKLCNPSYREDNWIYRDGHSWNAMRKSTWEMLFEKFHNEIYGSLSRFREPKNLTQQLYTYWVYFNEKYSEREFETKYFQLAMNGKHILPHLVCDGKVKIICINDKYCTDVDVAKKNIHLVLNHYLDT